MMEFCPEPITISTYLANGSETLSFPLKLLQLTKVAQALYFIHKSNVIHMDLSFGNIIILKNSVRVIDFG